MKKLLILVMLMGFTSVASAGLQLYADGNPIVIGGENTIASAGVITIDGDMATSDVQFILSVEVASGDLTLDISDLRIPHPGWIIMPPIPSDPHHVIISGGSFMGDPVGSVAFTGLKVIGVDGVLTLTETLSDQSTVVSTITVTPEPMTMALLGLGGLFIRRRK